MSEEAKIRNYQNIMIYSGLGLVHSAIYRIVSAFRKTAVVYIE